MSPLIKKPVILVVEDDEDDFLLLRDVLKEAGLTQELKWFQDGELFLDYLFGEGGHTGPGTDKIGLVFMDINMPKINGLEAINHIKSHSELRRIPLIVLSTSENELDIERAYTLGANSFVIKPQRYSEYLETIKTIHSYWFKTVKLPGR